MVTQIECRTCGINIDAIKTDKKISSGAWIYVHTDGSRVVNKLCKDCLKNRRIDYYTKNKAIWRNYEKTINGYLMRTYRNMLSRVTGIQHKKSHLYLGKEILEKELFYKWSLDSQDFLNLFKAYEESGFDQKLSPSIDRIDSSLGYSIGNIRWLTHSENSSLGARSRKLSNPSTGFI